MANEHKKIAPSVGAPEGKKGKFIQDYYTRLFAGLQRYRVACGKKGRAFQ